MESDNGFYIADWIIDPNACLISQGENSVHLEPKVMDLLVYMAQRSEQVHSREELLENVWQGTVVSDEALTNVIIKLRKAFNDDAHHPQFIETLPKRGYRLIAEVSNTESLGEAGDQQEIEHYKSERDVTKKAPKRNKRLGLTITLFVLLIAVVAGLAWIVFDKSAAVEYSTEPTSLALPNKPSIAVLPFVNTGNNPDYSYFSDGITDDLITDLSSISGLFVISRNSTFQYKGQAVDARQVASTLGVRYILEGSVRRSGVRVRINAQLIDGATGGQLWAARYDGELEQVFELQDQVTAKIIAALSLKLTEQDRIILTRAETTNPAAYDEFLKGSEYRWRISRESFAQAEKHFRKALEIDPNYARAHAALALIYWQSWQQNWHANSGSQTAGWVRARRELDAAMTDPTPLAFSLRSTMQLHNRRYEEAIREAQRSVALNSSSATGFLALADVLSFSGQSRAAIENSQKALRRDPNFPAPYLFVEGRSLFDSQRYAESILTLKRAMAANSADNNPMIFILASLGHLGRLDDARETLKQLNTMLLKDKLPEFTLTKLSNRWPYKEKADLRHLRTGLIKANVPEW